MFQRCAAIGDVGAKEMRAETKTSPAREVDPHGALDYWWISMLCDCMPDMSRTGNDEGSAGGRKRHRAQPRADRRPDLRRSGRHPGVRGSLMRYARTHPEARALLRTLPVELDWTPTITWLCQKPAG